MKIKIKLKTEEEIGYRCQSCSSREGTVDLHACPYQCEINDNYEDGCNCCPDCEHQCAMDI
jgi:hypothetical protein